MPSKREAHAATPRKHITSVVERLMPVWNLVQETGLKWSEDSAPRLGAALAYYAMFSLGPLLVIVVAIAGVAYGQDAARRDIIEALTSLLGPTGAQGVAAMLAGASRPREGLVATILGLTVLVIGAIGVVAALKDALNVIWRVEHPQRRTGLWGLARTYLISVAGVLALGFLMMVSLGMTAIVTATSNTFFSGAYALEAINFAVSFAIMTVMFAMMFKWLPDAVIAWRDVWPGALLTAVLFDVGKLLIGFYLGNQALESTYGAAASFVVILVWTYYSAQIVFLGAEFTEVYARHFGSKAVKRPRAPKRRRVET